MSPMMTSTMSFDTGMHKVVCEAFRYRLIESCVRFLTSKNFFFPSVPRDEYFSKSSACCDLR
jgi:hypothetical protein